MTEPLSVIVNRNTITTSPPTPGVVPALFAAAGERAALRFLEFGLDPYELVASAVSQNAAFINQRSRQVVRVRKTAAQITPEVV